ncbi:glycosyltransferase [Aureibaculum marinum]|uniref:Glycosyltransferase n=1 Tax=Aureibaculum marinum TaxID=2487930 RepID=A0A3N4NYR2_9FLAO|nr:glycosyltransferase family 4 protein [Aureibaculum marinum]RPD98006.1 glycosyltransferase [Aureibaculum marinum]
MKNIVYITSAKVGLHRFTYNELKLLKQKGINFYLCLTQLKDGPCMPDKNWNTITAKRITAILQFIKLLLVQPKNTISYFIEAKNKKVLSYFFIALSFYKDLKGKKVDLIHCQMGDKKLYTGYFLKKLFNIPLTVTVHAHELYQREVYDKNDQIKTLFASCDKVLTISEFNREIIKDKLGVKESKVEIMRLFPDIDTLNYVKDKKKILIVANWVEKKGYDILFNAVKKLERKDFVVWVVGGSNYDVDAIDVNDLIDKYKIKDKVAVLGRQGSPILDILFEACDIFCLPSYTDYYEDGNPSEREGIPVALMEAMAWGKPVIATRHAGNPELIEQLLVEERDVDGLKDALKYLLDNPEKWEDMGRKNKEIIQNKFSKTNVEVLVNTINNSTK